VRSNDVPEARPVGETVPADVVGTAGQIAETIAQLRPGPAAPAKNGS
jgi:hypothetical protein